MSYDEQPDGDPHGECAAEIHRLEAERDALRALLAVEQELALRHDPFICDEVECCLFGKPIRAGDCKCHTDKAREHREKVRAALREGNAAVGRGEE